MTKQLDLILRLADITKERHPVSQLAAILDGDQLKIELEFRPVRASRRRFGLERPAVEDVVKQIIEDGLLTLDDPEDLGRLPDHDFTIHAVHRAEAIVHERDPRADRLDRGGEDGDPLSGHAHGTPEKTELLGQKSLFAKLAPQILLGITIRHPLAAEGCDSAVGPL